jgi:hypothetical protein
MIKYYKSHSGFRGIFWGTLSFIVLEFGMIVGLAGFDNRGIWDYGVVPYLLILSYIAITAILLTISIILKIKMLRIISCCSEVIILFSVLAILGYNLWWFYNI